MQKEGAAMLNEHQVHNLVLKVHPYLLPAYYWEAIGDPILDGGEYYQKIQLWTYDKVKNTITRERTDILFCDEIREGLEEIVLVSPIKIYK